MIKYTILALMLLPMNSQAQHQQYQQVNDIPYTASDDAYAQERCKLDVYYPTNQKDASVVVWFHGGGIEGGNKHIDEQLKNSGLVVVAANYRLLPKAHIDDILDDAAAAVAWAYKNIEKYGGSHRKIFVSRITISANSRTSLPCRPLLTNTPRSPTFVQMPHLSLLFLVTGN